MDLSSPEALNESEKLIPFPTGQKLQERTTSSDTTLHKYLLEQHKTGNKYFGLANKVESKDALFLIDWSVKTGDVSVTVNPEGNIKLLTEFLNLTEWLSTENDTTNAVAMAKTLGDNVVLTLDLYNQIDAKIKEAINRHHLYLKNNSKAKNERILKNYAVTALYDIIRNPKNLREAQSSVDVMTSTAKGLTKSSIKNTVQKTFTPGNVLNKIQSINENMVGKDGIAICATGLKSFYALTHMYNTIINNSNLEETEALLFNVPLGGKTYHGLANANANSNILEKIAYSDNPNLILEQYLLDQQWESDAANESSAFLSLSTDNAKELALAKLNAGPETLGMYLYGLSLGVPVNTLFKIMTSPVAFRLAELAKGDLFNGNKGCNTILGAIDYLHKFPLDRLASFDILDLKAINALRDKEHTISPASQLAYKLVTDLTIGKVKDEFSFNKFAQNEHALEIIESLRNQVNAVRSLFTSESDFDLYKTSYDQALDFIKDYITDIQLFQNSGTYETVHGVSQITSDLEMLAMGAEELKLIGKILRLNQEIKTNALDLQKQVANIEECITRRINLINRAKNRGSSYLNRVGIQLTKDQEKYPNNYIFNLERFVTNKNYQKEQIARYDAIKHSYNPLRILTTDPQYKGYLEMLYIAHKGLKGKQLKYNFTVTKVAEFIKKYHVKQNLQQQVLKNANNYIDLNMRQDWMRYSKFRFTIPASNSKSKTYAFIGDFSKPKPLYFKKSIQLGTDVGDANFKLWMERTIIPKLKADPELKDNIFIQHLSPIVNTNTNLGMPAVYYGLNGINMLPQSDTEREVLDLHKDGFNSLSTYKLINDANGKGTTVQDLLYLYSLICNNGKLGPNSLHKIFEDYLNSDIATSYKQFISLCDQSALYFDSLVDCCTDETLAPTGSPWAGGSDLIKYKDLNAEKMLLYKKDKKQQSEVNDDSPYEYEDIPEDAFYYGEEEFDNTLHVNNYTRQESSALGVRDYSFFSNIQLERDGLGSVHVMPSTLEFTKEHPIRYTLNEKNEPLLVSIEGDPELVEKYVQLCQNRPHQAGQLPQILVKQEDGSYVNMIDENQINNELNSLINCG